MATGSQLGSPGVHESLAGAHRRYLVVNLISTVSNLDAAIRGPVLCFWCVQCWRVLAQNELQRCA